MDETGARRASWAIVVLIVAATACVSSPAPDFALAGAALSGSFGERTRVMELTPGVTATIVAPAALDPTRRIDLVLYALPNGNTTAQTMGRRMSPGLDWHYDIQHIAAQTRALRTMGMPQAIVVYLEADSKSWPAWRQKLGYDIANPRIVRHVDELRAAIGADAKEMRVTLTGHSGGGSFIFGFIEGQDAIPGWIERIAFLDANYNFDTRHGPKLERWLRNDARHTLVVVAYDDREITLDGKKVVSDSGGTWRATERMMRYLRGPFTFVTDSIGAFVRHRAGQVEVLAHPNPQNRILHTEMIGEMNAYMHAMMVRRPEHAGVGELLRPARAYTRWVEPQP